MKIDGWDIAEAGAQLWRRVIGHHSIKNTSEWNDESERPIFTKNGIGWKDISIDIMVRGNGYEDIRNKRGTILSKLRNPVVIESEWDKHKFKAILKDFDPEEKVKEKWHILKLKFIGYEYGDEQRIKVQSSVRFEINNIGNMETPVTLIIRPTDKTHLGEQSSERVIALINENGKYLYTGESGDDVLISYEETYQGQLIIKGLSTSQKGNAEDIVIRNVTKGCSITIEGETGIITQDGKTKIEDVDIWALPSLQPGINVIETNGEFMEITVIYYPRYQ